MNFRYLSDDGCKVPTVYPCPTNENCEISFYNDVELDYCNDKKANYIAIEYLYLPCKYFLLI